MRDIIFNLWKPVKEWYIYYEFNKMLSEVFRIVRAAIFILGASSLYAQSTSCSALNGNFGQQVIARNVAMITQSYRTAKDYTGRDIRLHADIYQGTVSWNQNQKRQRPLLVLYHGGGFKSGGRNTSIMQIFAWYFAQRGYVVVSAEYRTGWENSDGTKLCGSGTRKDYLDAQYRAVQDERALIQYFKSQSNTIGFDTNRIFLFGISSGATLVCSRLEDEWISLDQDRAQRLGSLEVFEGNRNYSTDVSGILSFAGANLTPQVSSDYNTPIAFFHGTCDNAVPYRQQYLASCSNMGYYYGPEILTKELDALNICYRNYVYCGFGHDLAAVGDEQRTIPWALQDVFDKSIHFMQSVMCEECLTSFEIANQQGNIKGVAECSRPMFADICGEVVIPEKQKIELTPNLFYDDYTIYIHSDFEQAQEVILNVYNMSGMRIQTEKVKIPVGAFVQRLQLMPLAKGVYLYQLIDGKEIFTSGKIWKM